MYIVFLYFYEKLGFFGEYWFLIYGGFDDVFFDF